MLKKLFFSFSIFVAIIVIGLYLCSISQPKFFIGTNNNVVIDQSKSRVLVICLSDCFGGQEVHALEHYKMLLEHGYNTSMLVPYHSLLHQKLQKLGLSHYTSHVTWFEKYLRPLYHAILTKTLNNIFKQNQFDIIHCNSRQETHNAIKIKKSHPVHIVYTRHVPDEFAIEKIRGIDAVAVVSTHMLSYIEKENAQRNLDIKCVTYIPPFFNAQPFLIFQPTESRSDFFKKYFSINLTSAPIITMTANFYQNLMHKNHPLLFQAIKILVHDKKKPVQVMLAGDGTRKKYLQKLAQQLNLTDHIHFLGFTDNIPGLLYHSNIFVLSSSQEAFGLSYLEAGLMKKPSIGATQTGAEFIIVHENTGLIFKNGDAANLAQQIERLIDNPAWARELGKNAYQHVITHFLPQASFAKYEALYQKLVKRN